jgi:ABC-2 type transport system ATP-binding protein
VHVQRPADLGDGIARALADRNVSVSRAERIVPSLEDVFVSLIEARDRQERPQAEVAG